MSKKLLIAAMIIVFVASSALYVNNIGGFSSEAGNLTGDVKLESNATFDSELNWLLAYNPKIQDISVIIMFKAGYSSAVGEELLSITGIGSLHTRYVYKSFNGVSAKISRQALSELSALPYLSKVYLDREYRFETPEASLTSRSVNALYESGLEAIGADYLQASGYLGSGIRIAILDSGISSTHPDFTGRIVASQSFVEGENITDLNGHGTHVAGIAAGSGAASNGLYKGVAPEALLINAKCAQSSGLALTSDIIAAIEWSAYTQNADILSISLGGGIGDPNDPLSIAVDQAASSGVLVSISSGNSGPNYASTASPAAAKKVISVGASDYNDRIVDFSSRGPTVDGRVSPDVVAPGYQVISALESNSVIGLVSQYYLSPDPRIRGSGSYISGYYYIALSGTSMSAPFVSGGAALLLSAFPNLKGNPQAIKSALMNTASKLVNGSGVEYGPNVQGSGRINVTAAYNYLAALNSSSSYIPTTTILPNNAPIDPYQLMFPGQQVNIIVKFLTGEPVNLTIKNILAYNSSSFIGIGNDTFTTSGTWNITVQDYLDIGLYISLPLNVSPGIYNGRVEIINTTSGISLHNITVSLRVAFPLARIYFDILHNRDFEDTPLINYRLLIYELMGKNYSVNYGENLLTYEFLKNYDLIVLPDIEIQLFSFEITGLERYLSEGGSLLILGSFYPLFASESVNLLLSTYGIQYDVGYQGNLLSYNDLGISRLYQSLNVNDIVSHPITTGVASYTFGSGISLKVSSPAKVLARISDKPVLAAYDNDSVTGGRVVVYSNEITFYSENIYSTSLNNLKLIHNTINWLLKENQTLITVAAENTVVENSGPHTENIYIYVSQNNIPVEGLVNGTSIIGDLNGTSPLTISELGGGRYYTSFNASGEGSYKVNVRVNSGSITGSDSAQIVIAKALPSITSVSLQKSGTMPPDLSYPSWVKFEEVNENVTISKYGEVMTVRVNASYTDNILIGLNSDPQSFYEITRRNITYNISNMTNIGGSAWSYEIAPNASSYIASTYPILIVPMNDSIGAVKPSSFIITEILIVGAEPSLDSDETTIGGTLIDSLQKYDLGGGSTIPIYYYTFGAVASMSTAGSDRQDNAAQMKAYIWIIDVIFYYYFGQPLYVMELEYDSTNHVFTGSMIISSQYISTPAGTVALRTNWAYNIIFFLVNSEGEFDQSIQVLLVFQQGFGFLTSPFIFIIIGIIIMTLPFYILQRRRLKKTVQQAEELYKPYIETPPSGPMPETLRFCPYCGAKVNVGDIYCLSCGQLLPDHDFYGKDAQGPET